MITTATTTALYLCQTCVIGLNANTIQDLLDVLGIRVLIAIEGGEQVSGNVTHPEEIRLIICSCVRSENSPHIIKITIHILVLFFLFRIKH